MSRQEWHVTVTGDPIDWYRFCNAMRGYIKPLWIELNTFERQLMCACTAGNPSEMIMRRGFRIVRVKHEVQPHHIDITSHNSPQPVFLETPLPTDGVLYYESHVKFDGVFLPGFPMASRDLYRDNRWYLTHRSEKPFDHDAFVQDAIYRVGLVQEHNVFAGAEHEACLHDSYPELDARWVR